MYINEPKVQSQLAFFNKQHKTSFTLDVAHCYGGYCLANATNSTHYTVRMSSKEMYQFIAGMTFIAACIIDKNIK